MTKASKKINRKFIGTVVSAKVKKTVVVAVNRQVTHKKYGKKYQVTRRFACHDEQNRYCLGDQVMFQECRPLSKNKRWRVIKKIS